MPPPLTAALPLRVLLPARLSAPKKLRIPPPSPLPLLSLSAVLFEIETPVSVAVEAAFVAGSRLLFQTPPPSRLALLPVRLPPFRLTFGALSIMRPPPVAPAWLLAIVVLFWIVTP